LLELEPRVLARELQLPEPAAVLDAAAIRRCLLVGHSDGASIAAIHAGTEADKRVRGLVLMAPHYFVEAMTITAIEAARQAYEQGDLRSRLARHHADVDGAFRGWNGAWLDPAFPAAFDLTAELAGIRVPVLQLQGGADPYGSVAQTAMAERLVPGPLRTVVLPGVGHAPHLQARDATLDAIRAFAREGDLWSNAA